MTRDPIRALVVGIDDELERELTNEEGFTVDRGRTPGRASRRPMSPPWSSRSRANRSRRSRRSAHTRPPPPWSSSRAPRTPPTARSPCTRGPTITSFAERYPPGCSRGRSDTPSPSGGSGASSPPRMTRRACRTSAGSPRSPSTTCGWPTAATHRWCSCSSGWKGSDRSWRRAERTRPRRWRATPPSLVLEAVRDADVPARISEDTFCVLLTGEARGAEALVLSRLVEAIAVNDARLGSAPAALALGRERALRPRSAQHAGADLLDRRPTAGGPSRARTIRGLMSCEYPSTPTVRHVRTTRSCSELTDRSTCDPSPERAGGGHRPR